MASRQNVEQQEDGGSRLNWDEPISERRPRLILILRGGATVVSSIRSVLACPVCKRQAIQVQLDTGASGQRCVQAWKSPVDRTPAPTLQRPWDWLACCPDWPRPPCACR
jgi:hypothetical protein